MGREGHLVRRSGRPLSGQRSRVAQGADQVDGMTRPYGPAAATVHNEPVPDPVWCSASLTNRSQLLRHLRLPPDTSHAEVLAAALDRWGAEAHRWLRGAWAYAREDGDGLLVVRDPLGIMPAYWVRTASSVVVTDSFAEAVRLAGDDPAQDPEYAWAARNRALHTVPTGTVVASVRRVPPGTAVRVTRTGAIATAWWRPQNVHPIRRPSVASAASELRELLVRAVEDEVSAALEGTPPALGRSGIAAHMSGGLDSTTVALLAQRALSARGLRLDAVASWSPHPDLVRVDVNASGAIPFDEREVIGALAEKHDVPVLFGPAASAEAGWLNAVPPTHLPRETLHREAYLLPRLADLGVTTVLSGWGGDEFASFNGRRTHRALIRSLRWGPSWQSYQDLRRRGQGRTRAASRLALEALPDRPWSLRAPSRGDEALLVEGDGAYAHLAAAHRAYLSRLRSASSPRAVQLQLVASDHLARRIESWHEAGQRFGITYRYPLLDVRIVEWALAMPPEAFRLGEHSRRVFRLAVDGLVPDHIRRTTKADPVLVSLAGRGRTTGSGDRSV